MFGLLLKSRHNRMTGCANRVNGSAALSRFILVNKFNLAAHWAAQKSAPLGA